MPSIDIPVGLPALVRQYRERQQRPVRFRPGSWDKALQDHNTGLTSSLADETLTQTTTGGDRTVRRSDVLEACASMDTGDRVSVLSTFVLVMAWGSGTTGNRSLRNTRLALADEDRAWKVLSQSAETLRGTTSLSDGDLLDVHRTFRLPQIGQAFFTKWFAFAGHKNGRSWQPLILDSRVYATLNDTLGVSTRTLAGSRDRAERYWAYVSSVHAWAPQQRISAEQLEWMLFEHRGGELAQHDTTALPSP